MTCERNSSQNKNKNKNFSFMKTKALLIFDGSFQVRNHVQVIKVGPGGKILWIPVAGRAEDSIFCVRYEAFK
jgi:hypothetical protein